MYRNTSVQKGLKAKLARDAMLKPFKGFMDRGKVNSDRAKRSQELSSCNMFKS